MKKNPDVFRIFERCLKMAKKRHRKKRRLPKSDSGAKKISDELDTFLKIRGKPG